MQTLNELSSENIRQNWDTYKDHVRNTPYYDTLWKTLIDKSNIDESNTYFSILKNFIDNENTDYKTIEFTKTIIQKIDNNTLVFKGLKGELRLYIHELCDKIGLYHESKTTARTTMGVNRDLYIYKPTSWLWEYTEKNPYLSSSNRNRSRSRSRNSCDLCGKYESETELFRCVAISGTYCDECIDTISDGDGHDLCDFKFESI
jgi:hypothetical protein